MATLLKAYEKVEMLLMLSEGEIEGPYTGDLSKDIFFDKTPIRNPNGSLNFKGISAGIRTGTQSQTYVAGFDIVSNEVNVGINILNSAPVVRNSVNPCDRFTVKLAFPSGLTKSNSDGKQEDTSVQYKIELAVNGGPFVEKVTNTVNGQSDGYFPVAHTFATNGSPPYLIKVTRLTRDNTISTNPTSSERITDDLAWISYTEINDVKLRYPNTALLGLRVDAEQFRRGLPNVLVRLKGIKLQIPTNYNPITRTYTGVWNGAFKQEYSNNPAWVLYDLIVEKRYGLGNYIDANRIDKWGLYAVAKYCDGLVPDGLGGYEPRFVCNVFITTQEEAFRLLNNLISVFRGMSYYAGGMVAFAFDAPNNTSPMRLYSDANVVTEFDDNGTMTRPPFAYKSTDIAARHTVAFSTYADFKNYDEPTPVLVEELQSIERYGYRPIEFTSFGCSSAGQAQRLCKWLLITELLEQEVVTFDVGLEGLVVIPGEIIKIADFGRAKQRFAGRIKSGGINSVEIDDPVTLIVGKTYQLSVLLPIDEIALDENGNSYTKSVLREFIRTVINPPGVTTILNITPALPGNPTSETMWMLSGDVEPKLFRVLSIGESSAGRYSITATAHDPSKYGYADTPGNLNV